MNFDLIEQLVQTLLSIPIDPYIFINGQFYSSCSLKPIGAIIIECQEINFNECKEIVGASAENGARSYVL